MNEKDFTLIALVLHISQQHSRDFLSPQGYVQNHQYIPLTKSRLQNFIFESEYLGVGKWRNII